MTQGRFGRRAFLAGLTALPLCHAALGSSSASARVVVVGGGFAGAAASRLLKTQEPGLAVTLVEPAETFHTCPRSNAVIAGLAEMPALTWSYRGLEMLGIRHERQAARDVDPVRQRVQLADRRWLDYDWLVFATGIDFAFSDVEGHSAELAAERVPHAWKAGAQTLLLRKQLQAMPDGGRVLLSVPGNPYRCPPGPYERASLIAWYLSRHKPRSKVLILDAKDSFSKQALFQEGWQQLFPGMVEWLGHADDGKVVRLDAKRQEVECEFGSRHGAEVINLIPPQHAGALAQRIGLVDASGWVPVQPTTFRALRAPRILAIGDACIAAPMPKSAHSAHAQARLAVAALLAELRGAATPPVSLDNTCYSLLAPDVAVSISARYRVAAGRLEEAPGTLQLSPLGAPGTLREQEAREADGWYQAIGQATWGARP